MTTVFCVAKLSNIKFITMKATNSENEKFHLIEAAVRRFEEYENAVCNNIESDSIFQHQDECLNTINEMILYEDSNSYSTALFYIRENLLKQMKNVESRKDEIILNDLTITRTCNPNSEQLPTLSKLFSAQGPETKKFKKDDSKPNETLDKLRDIIKNTLVVPQSSGLADIAGLEEVKSILREAIIIPNKFPHLFGSIGIKRLNKALLYGPPGTGKTQLAHCLAAEIHADLYCVSTSDLWSSYVGESEKLVKMLFQHCHETGQQCLIFIDEIDSICRARNSTESDLERRFKNQLLIQMSDMDRNSNKIFFLACTNCPWDLDHAFIRRFQRRIYIPLPDRETRLQILKNQSKSSDLLNYEQWNQIVNHTEGWSGSDITELVNFAKFQPIKELSTANQWIITEDNLYMPVKKSNHSTLKLSINEVPPNKVTVRQVELSDYYLGLQNIKKTVPYISVKKFEDFNAK